MAVLYCPNCRSAVSSRERRCWICNKALAPPAPTPNGTAPTYPQRMRLVRFEETAGGLTDGFRCRIVYLKSVEDRAPVRDYWQAAREQKLVRIRRAGAALAASLTVALIIVIVTLAVPTAQTFSNPPERAADVPTPRLAPPAPPIIRPSGLDFDPAAESTPTGGAPVLPRGDMGLTSPAPASWGGDD